MSSSQRIFPIKSKTACLLKWSWSTIFFNSGSTASCHRTIQYPIDPNNFDQFHNLPGKLNDRRSMLNGEWPESDCRYCKLVEDIGGYSDRQMQLDAQQDPGLTPPELTINNQQLDVTPTIVEAFFNNTCNMKCVYCGPAFSSLWEDENRKFGSLAQKQEPAFSVRVKQHNLHYDKMVDDFWKYLSSNDRYKVIRRFHILGGEPFLIKEIDQCIDFWKDHPNPDLVVSVISNLNIPHDRFVKYIDRFEQLVLTNKIWKFQLTASLDCRGDEQTYTRFGLDLDLWDKNFNYVLGNPNIIPSINSSISVLTIRRLPDLLNLINEWNKKQAASDAELIQHSFSTSYHFDNPYMFNGEMFNNDFKTILSLMPEDNDVQKNQKLAMQGIADRMSESTTNVEKIERFKNYLDDLDRRRGTNWRALFPWLDKDFIVK